jgi:serine protease Do
VIVSVDSKPIQHVGQFQRIVASYHPGDQVTLEVIRYGARRQVRVALAEAPPPEQPAQVAQRPTAPAADATGSRLGIAVAPLTADLARQLNYAPNAGGIVITDVQPYGPAGRVGLRRGTRILAVDGERVPDVAAFRQVMARKRDGQVVSLTVQAGDQSSILNVRLPE